MTKQLPEGHVVRRRDQKRIRCEHPECTEPAYYCEYHQWEMSTRPVSRGISFYYFCQKHTGLDKHY